VSKRIINLVAGLIAATGIVAAHPAAASGPIGGLGNAKHVTIWVPDYYGHNVIEYKFYYAMPNSSPTFSTTVVKLPSSGAAGRCNPNALAMPNSELYIVCNSDWGGPDAVVGYNTSTHAYKLISGVATDGHNYFNGSHLVGIVVDGGGNLWVSAFRKNDLLRIPSSQLPKTSPKIDRQVVHSPDSPVGLALDPSNKSIWVVGQYEGGIVLNLADSVLNGPAGSHLGATALNPNPSSCISNSAAGCQTKPQLFNNPEGIAVFDSAVWVSNNGGGSPGKTIVRLTASKNQLTATTYGDNTSKPFACPGGMFAVTAPSGGKASLWINDEGYDVSHTDCGASNSDQGSHFGRVLQFLATGLQNQTSPAPVQFTDWDKLSTSSPGFGGIVVQIY
jgi:hypothetical protein